MNISKIERAMSCKTLPDIGDIGGNPVCHRINLLINMSKQYTKEDGALALSSEFEFKK